MNCATEKAKHLIHTMPTKELVEQFVALGKMGGTEFTENVPTVRGWYMEEFNKRNSDAYNAWLEMEEPEDEDLLVLFAES